MRKIFYFSLAFATIFTACETTDEPERTVIPYSEGAYVLNSGLDVNSSTLSYYDFTRKEVSDGVFDNQNGEALGDKANNMCIYGSKMYIAVTGSGKIEITDLKGKRIERIMLQNESGQPLKPRYMASHGNYVYFTTYGGHVQRIETMSLELAAKKVQVGDFPEGLTVAGNKLFVCNSNFAEQNTTDEGNTLSVIDLNTFTEIKKVPVTKNPHNQILTARDGNIYFVSTPSWNEPSVLSRINPNNYETVAVGEGSTIAAHENTIYVYFSLWGGDTWFKTYDITTGKYSDKNFIDPSIFSYIPAINTNPVTGELYICDAPSKVKGDVSIYNNEGVLVKKFEVGVSPYGTFFPNNEK
ncbi:MAG: DUF5074 domain-containing protein [Bacteroidales bacterium]